MGGTISHECESDVASGIPVEALHMGLKADRAPSANAATAISAVASNAEGGHDFESDEASGIPAEASHIGLLKPDRRP